jgi:hypothetical protein
MLWGHFTVRAAFWRQLLAAEHKPSTAARAREPARVGAWRGSLSGCECAVKTVVLNDIVKLTGERVGFVIYQVKVLHGLDMGSRSQRCYRTPPADRSARRGYSDAVGAIPAWVIRADRC